MISRTTWPRLAPPLLVPFLVAAIPPRAYADATPDQIAAARALGRAGVAEVEAGDCAAAVPKLARAEALYHAPTTAEPLGECQIEMGKIVEGTEALAKLAGERLPASAPPAFVAAQARARDVLARSLPKIAKLRVRVATPPGAGAAVVTIDGDALNPALLDNERPTDPGAHAVRASALGCVAVEKAITLAEGDNQVLAFALTATAVPPDSPAAGSNAGPTVTSSTVVPEPDASAQAPKADGVRTHDGFYFRAGLGAAVFASGSISPPGSSVDPSVSGAGPSVELAFGGTPWRGVVVGGGIYGMSAPSPSYAASGASLSGGAAIVSSIGPFVDWYIDPAAGWHVQAAIGLASIAASKGTATEIGGTSYTYPGADESGAGVSLLAGVGYEWWVGEQTSFGLLARLQYVSGSVKATGDTESTGVKLVVPALLGTFTYH